MIALIQEKSYGQLEIFFPINNPKEMEMIFNKKEMNKRIGIEIDDKPIPNPESNESKESAIARRNASLADNIEE